MTFTSRAMRRPRMQFWVLAMPLLERINRRCPRGAELQALAL